MWVIGLGMKKMHDETNNTINHPLQSHDQIGILLSHLNQGHSWNRHGNSFCKFLNQISKVRDLLSSSYVHERNDATLNTIYPTSGWLTFMKSAICSSRLPVDFWKSFDFTQEGVILSIHEKCSRKSKTPKLIWNLVTSLFKDFTFSLVTS